MFSAFSEEKLDHLLQTFPVSSDGRRYITEALLGPSRNVSGTTRNVVSGLPNPKMGFTLDSESLSGERPFILEKTFDDACIGLTTQPPRIEIVYKGKNGKTVRTRYTPDCLAFYRDQGAVVEEWKPAEERGRLDELYPGKYILHLSGEYGSEAIEAVFRPMGLKFRLRFTDEINATAHRNRLLLRTYLQPAAVRQNEPLLVDLMAKFSAVSQRNLADLIEEGASRDVIYWALATGRLFFDINAVPLSTEAALVQVFRHKVTLDAWAASTRQDGSRPSPRWLESTKLPNRSSRDLRSGDVIVLDGRRLTVRFVGLTGLITRDQLGDPVELSYSELEVARFTRKLELPAQQHVGVPNQSPLYAAGPATLNRAIAHAAVLQKLDRAESLQAEELYSAATIRRWRKMVREGLSRGLSPVESLIDGAGRRGFHGPHFDPKLSVELDEVIELALKNRLDKSLLTIYGEIEKSWEAKGRLMVAKSTFYERVLRIRSPATVAASQGHKAAHQIEPAHWILTGSTPLHGEHAMAWVHIDSTLLDVEVRSSLSGAVLGRPWLTLAICAFTRRVLGFHLSFRPPSYVSSMMVLADVIRRTGRLPEAIIHDWGPEFKAKDHKVCLATLFIERHVRPKGSPRFGSVVERLFGVTTRQLIDSLAGNTKARRNVRKLSPSADPSWHSGLWLLDLYLGLEEFFIKIYNTRKHPATLLTPDAAFDHSLVMHGARLHRLRNLEDVLPIISPTARGRSRTVDPARGLYINYRYYSNKALTGCELNGADLVVRPVPFDPGVVLTFFKGEWIACRTPLTPEVTNAPEVVRRCLYEEWSLEQKLVGADADRARRDLRDLLEQMNSRAMENRSYWDDRQYRDLFHQDHFPNPEAADNTPQKEVQLEMMKAAMSRAVAAAMSSASFGSLASA